MSHSKSITTLVEDIKGVLSAPSSIELSEETKVEYVDQFLDNLERTIHDKLINRKDKQGTLRMSNFGQPDRKLWYTVNTPKDAEDMSPEAYLKFLYGDVIEELILLLAKLAGHEVTGEQDELDLDGLKGHRDALIDGELVDVKSASTFAFKKFERNGLRDDDAFGYLDQIGLYKATSHDVVGSDVGHFLAVDKQLGKITLDTYGDLPEVGHYRKELERKRSVLASDTVPPRCHFDEPDGKSGNRKLGIECSYCPFKRVCWKGLQAYAYSSGPRFLTVVKKEPDVPRIY